MKTIRAYSCIRDGARNDTGNPSGKSAGAVCVLLNEAYAGHTLRTFLRGQGDRAVLELMSDDEASRLLGRDADPAPVRGKLRSKKSAA